MTQGVKLTKKDDCKYEGGKKLTTIKTTKIWEQKSCKTTLKLY